MAIEAGDGRRWILLPGTLCTGAVFDPFLDALGVPIAARQVVELRHPAVEDYLPELAALADPRAVICGFSLGAIVAAHLADRVAAADCLFFGLNPHADAPAKRQGRLDLAVDVARLGGSAALAARLGPLAGPEPEAARARVLALAEAAGPWIEAQTRLALERPGALPALGRTSMPVTMLTGTADEQAPLELAHEAARSAPKGRVMPLKDLGHYALVEDPVACASAVNALWGRA
jgi:pimeloyl-ACP methyl ester carboxylesterase